MIDLSGKDRWVGICVCDVVVVGVDREIRFVLLEEDLMVWVGERVGVVVGDVRGVVYVFFSVVDVVFVFFNVGSVEGVGVVVSGFILGVGVIDVSGVGLVEDVKGREVLLD